MGSPTEVDLTPLAPIVQRQSEKVAARYDGVEADDLAQEVWVHIMEGGLPKAPEYIETGQPGRLTNAVYNIAVKWCETDKRAKLKAAGIDWRDDYNYSRPEVARLLPMALDSAIVPGLSGDGLHDGPAARSDPAYGGGMLAGIIDVRVAYSKLSEPDRQFVLIVVGLDTNWDQIAATTGLLAQSAYAKYMRILDRMVTRHLGRKTDEDEAPVAD